MRVLTRGLGAIATDFSCSCWADALFSVCGSLSRLFFGSFL